MPLLALDIYKVNKISKYLYFLVGLKFFSDNFLEQNYPIDVYKYVDFSYICK